MAAGLCSLGRGTRTLICLPAAAHLVGAIAGGVSLGLVISFATGFVGLARMGVLVFAAALVLAVALSLRRMQSCGLKRQVPRGWGRTMRPTPRFGLWGAQLGVGVATVVPYPAFVLVVAMESVSDLPRAILIGFCYGFGRGSANLASGAFIGVGSGPSEAARLLPTFRGHARVLNVALIGVAGATLVAGVLP